ncbi:hypothetical protein VTN02DRAFT_2292 [Thermoascus thermophilus]
MCGLANQGRAHGGALFEKASSWTSDRTRSASGCLRDSPLWGFLSSGGESGLDRGISALYLSLGTADMSSLKA